MKSKRKTIWNKLKRGVLAFLILYPGYYLLKGILATCRITIKGAENFISTADKDKCIVMLWHNRIAIGAQIFEKIAPHFQYGAVISNSRDGELLARFVSSYPQGKAIRVVHTAKFNALREIIENLNEKKRVIVMTPDGPQGPLYKVKPGIVAAARTTGAKVVPMNWIGNRVWRLNTWDKLMIPKPFSEITVFFGLPILFSETPSENDTAMLQEVLGP